MIRLYDVIARRLTGTVVVAARVVVVVAFDVVVAARVVTVAFWVVDEVDATAGSPVRSCEPIVVVVALLVVEGAGSLVVDETEGPLVAEVSSLPV